MKDPLGPEVKQVLMIVPNPGIFPSGGNIYNQRLMENWEQQGLKVLQVEEMDSCSTLQLEQTDVMFLDSLYLSASHRSFWNTLPNKKKVIIFHHLDCLELDIAEQKACFKHYWSYFEQADQILVTSDYSKEWLDSQGISPSKIISIPPRIPWEKPVQIRASSSLLKALIVANLIPRKGILPFLEYLLVEMPMDSPFELQIAGSDRLDSAYAEACQAIVRKNPLLTARVKFLGEILPENMPEIYQQADMLISASYMETFGMALQEAKAMGLPILALGSQTEGGNIHTFIREEDGDRLYPDMQGLVKGFLTNIITQG